MTGGAATQGGVRDVEAAGEAEERVSQWSHSPDIHSGQLSNSAAMASAAAEVSVLAPPHVHLPFAVDIGGYRSDRCCTAAVVSHAICPGMPAADSHRQ